MAEFIQQGESEEFQATHEQAAEAQEAARAKREATAEGYDSHGIDSKFHAFDADGKFDLAGSAAKQAESYKSLQSEFTKRNQDAKGVVEPQKTDALNADPLTQAAESHGDNPLATALAAATEAYESDGMTEEHFEALVAQGISREYIDQYIENFEAAGEQQYSELTAIAGGDAEYDALLLWAGTNLSPQEVTTFDTAIESGDHAQATLMIGALQARYESANGRTGNTEFGTGTQPGGQSGFADQAEYLQAIRDPRYKTSIAYRNETDQRLLASTSF